MDISNKVAVISGASSGIGKAVSLNFAKKGADIALCDINPNGLKDIQEQINLIGKKCIFDIVDVTSSKNVQDFINLTFKTYGHIDILVNCAGIFKAASFLELSEEDWDRMIATHLKGTFLMTKYAVNVMMAQSEGCIINIGSTSGMTGGTSGAHYAAAKGGIIAFTKSIGKELAKYGIRVNAIAPSKIETNMLRFKSQEEKDELIKKIPIGRIGKPEEIAEIIAFLASKESEYIIGEVIVASGGY